MICSKEEPLGINGNLSATDEQSENIYFAILSDFSIPQLNRYCFRLNRSDRQYELEALFEQLSAQLSGPITAISAWSSISGDFNLKIRAMLEASNKKKAGWAVWHDEPLYVAARAMKNDEITADKIEEFKRTLFFLFGQCPQLDDFGSAPFRRSVQSLFIFQRFFPSKEFLTSVGDRGLSLGYFLIDERAYSYFILVSPHRMDLSKLQEDGILTKILSGADIGSIW